MPKADFINLGPLEIRIELYDHSETHLRLFPGNILQPVLIGLETSLNTET